jgi:Family of unknown function (DUF6011)
MRESRRYSRRIAIVAQELREGAALVPSHRCKVCRRVLRDEESRRRGVGQDCWSRIAKELKNPAIPAENAGTDQRSGIT